MYPQWGRAQPLGQFGAVVYDDVLLDFKPDYVCSWMDPWMSTIHADTALRPFFRWIYMPCIDSTPQRYEWLLMYESCDYLMGYSDFAINVMKEQSPRIKAAGSKKLLPTPARPGVDMDVFKPLNKKEVREKWSLNPELPIVLSCMRNQQRKLFCELIDSFAKYKKDNKDDATAQKSVLLIHSTGFDAGQEYWTHIARLSTNEYLPYHYKDLHKHILHTYMCDGCGKKMVGFAIWLLHAQVTNGRAYMKCPCCENQTLRTPNTNVGFSREEMAEIFNLANLYVQVSIAGADEMPASEAKACGVPILISANAAMLEKAQLPKDFEGNTMYNKADGTPYTMHLGGVPINIAYEFHEAATMQRRSYFDRNDLAKKLKLLGDKEKLEELSKDAVKSIQDNCDYADIAKKWEYAIDNLPAKDRTKTWDKSINPQELPLFDLNRIEVPSLPDEQFVDWCYTNILRTTVDSVGRLSWINDLKAGRSRKDIVQYFASTAMRDKGPDILLHNHRLNKVRNEEMGKILSNPDTLKGIMVQ
jgi:glycosyltransferase involved in cell wall biosynthesis